MDLVPDKCIGWGSYGAVWTLRNMEDECIKIASPAKQVELHEILIREIFGATLTRRSCILLGASSWAIVMPRYKCNLSQCMTWDGAS